MFVNFEGFDPRNLREKNLFFKELLVKFRIMATCCFRLIIFVSNNLRELGSYIFRDARQLKGARP